jgi:hypothetical protein
LHRRRLFHGELHATVIGDEKAGGENHEADAAEAKRASLIGFGRLAASLADWDLAGW